MSAYVYPPVVPAGQAPPFAVVTETDHRAWIYVTTALGLALTLLASAIRVFIRAGTKSGYGVDDGALLISTVLALIQSILVLSAGSYGLGASVYDIPVSLQVTVEKLYYSSNLLYVISIGASRASVALFLRRLSPVKEHKTALSGLLVVEAVWTTVILLLTALQCDPGNPWILNHRCVDGWIIRWQVGETIGAILEVTTFAVAVWMLVWKLKLAFSKKCVVTTVFGLRLVMMLIAISLRLSSFDRKGFTTDPTLHQTSFICWTQAELNLSIIAATIPIAHNFLQSLVTNWGGAAGRSLSQSTYLSRGSNAIRLTTIQSNSTEKTDFSQSMNRSSTRQSSIMFKQRDSRISRGMEAAGTYGSAPGAATVPLEEEEERIRQSSVGTDDSRRMIIKKPAAEQVDHGTRWYE